MAKKTAVPTEEKFERQDFDLFPALSAVDKQDYEWFRNLTQEQQKKFSAYMMLHWVSSIKNNGPLAEYYVLATEQMANLHMFNEQVSNHPELQWMMLCASSPNRGKQAHTWIPHLSERYARYQEMPTKKRVSEYFSKIYSADADTINQAAEQYIEEHQHRHKLAMMYPTMKISDIETLASSITEQEVQEYEKESGR
jgi:hypothetical protein